jgi:YfiH family protein
VNAAIETFPALDAIPGIRAAFLTLVAGIDITTDRASVLARLGPAHEALVTELQLNPPVTAEQVHGAKVVVVGVDTRSPVAGTDGLATATPGCTLGIYVADCAAVYLVDPRQRAIALVHSGRKGTEANILQQAVSVLGESFGSRPEDIVAVVSPCIRPPHYEIDFAAMLADQARAAGIGSFHDAGVCTASHPERYYSYRRELGKTGRMLALLALEK